MKTRIILLAIAITTLALASCRMNINMVSGSGNVVTETRQVSDFSALVFAGAGDITITQGETEALTIEAEDNVIARIRTRVQDGKLIIDYDTTQAIVSPTRPIRFNLAVKNLNAIDLSGAGNILATDFKAERLTFQLSGAGNLKINRLEAQEIVVTASGAGNFDISGKVDKQYVVLSGFGNYNAGNLESQESRVTISGAGNAIVWARTNVDAHISGAGSISYYGNPQARRSVSGLGKINSLGTK
jgi:hypothetical protein